MTETPLACPSCGANNLPSASFCFNCGTPLKHFPEQPDGTKSTLSTGNPRQTRPHQWVFWLLSIVSGGVLIGLAVLLIFQSYKLSPELLSDFSFKDPSKQVSSGSKRVSAKELDRLRLAGAVFKNPINYQASIEKTPLDDLLKKSSARDRPVMVEGLITRIISLESLTEKDWPLAYVIGVSDGDEEILILYRGYTGDLRIKSPVRVQGMYVGDVKILHADQVLLLEDDPVFINWASIWLVRLALLAFIWMVFCTAFLLWRGQRLKWLKLSNILLIFGCFLILSGTSACEIQLTTSVNRDGSGLVSTSIIETTENMNFVRQIPEMQGYIDAWKRNLRFNGMLVDQYTIGNQENFLLQRQFSSIQEYNQSQDSLSQPSWTYLTKYEANNQTVYRLIAEIDTRTFFNDIPGIDPNAKYYVTQQFNQVIMTYAVNLPGDVVYHNGSEGLFTNRKWKLRMNDVNQIVIESRISTPSSPGKSSMRLIWVAAGLISIIIVSSILLLISLVGYHLPKREPK